MRASTAIAIAMVGSAAHAAEPVLPPEAAAVVQTALDAAHADPGCDGWRPWTEIELRADRAIVRPANGVGQAVLVHTPQRPWLRLDPTQSSGLPSGAVTAACLDRALRTTVTASVWRAPHPTRDRTNLQPVARTRSLGAVWAQLAAVGLVVLTLTAVALRRLRARAGPR